MSQAGIAISGPPQAECVRHGLPWVPSVRPGQGHYVVRCSHIGPRFVVHIRNHASGFNIVDYVEDLPGGEMVIEPCDGLGDADAAAAFDRLVSRMLTGDPPRPEE